MPELDRLLVVTPHPSGALPAEVLGDMLGPDLLNAGARESLLSRVFLDGDPFTDLIFHLPGARTVQASWSRFAVDLNRERGDRDENGVIKLSTFDREPLYPAGFTLSAAAREARLRRYWDPFHALVAQEAREATLVIVGHCMAPSGPALSHDTGTPRPGVCLMTGTPDAPTYPQARWAALRDACAAAFAPVLAGTPYPDVQVGVPWETDTISATYGAPGRAAFGIEMNSGLYLHADGTPRHEVIRALNEAFARFAPQALSLAQG
ncbi:N-formylglutamate amidohydrolase [Deinococcus sedimenti]|uniref:N-formylglutamate amidohydrolase n=1 Tax=Deinococcus sedimenti TaxID=1867090 RepID=UPI0016649079|nr:N-formylglutamate amidohydrolase [Deinococcus sedimenti]